jgi:alpha-L-rhamnosidase
MISRGATTIWETWKESDNVYSNCHPMFGSVTEWYYRWLAGIRPDPDFPGFKKFIISPSLPAGLSFVHCSYKSPFGIIKSGWEKSAKGVTFDITVPPSTSAKLIIPVIKNSIVKIENLDNKKVISQKAGLNEQEITLEEGNYRITD